MFTRLRRHWLSTMNWRLQSLARWETPCWGRERSVRKCKKSFFFSGEPCRVIHHHQVFQSKSCLIMYASSLVLIIIRLFNPKTHIGSSDHVCTIPYTQQFSSVLCLSAPWCLCIFLWCSSFLAVILFCFPRKFQLHFPELLDKQQTVYLRHIWEPRIHWHKRTSLHLKQGRTFTGLVSWNVLNKAEVTDHPQLIWKARGYHHLIIPRASLWWCRKTIEIRSTLNTAVWSLEDSKTWIFPVNSYSLHKYLDTVIRPQPVWPIPCFPTSEGCFIMHTASSRHWVGVCLLWHTWSLWRTVPSWDLRASPCGHAEPSPHYILMYLSIDIKFKCEYFTPCGFPNLGRGKCALQYSPCVAGSFVCL